MKVKKIAAGAMAAAVLMGNLTGLGAGQTVYAAELPEEAKVMELNFDGNLEDASGNGHTGTANKEATYVEGVNGQALYLDGSTYVDLGRWTDLQPENLTVAMWIKAEGALVGENMLTWFKPSGNYQGKGWYLSCLDNNVPLKISIGESTGQPMEAYVSANRSEFFPVGEWVHVAVTFDSTTQSVQIFRNGVAQEVLYLNTASYITQDASSNKYIGFNSPGYNGGFAKVVMDDFAIYNQVASAADVIGMYTEYGAEFDTSEVLATDLANLNLSLTTVKYDMNLPTEGNAGCTITWASSNEAVLTADGKVTRPAIGEADATVTLTATLEFAGTTATKEFEVTVPAWTDFSTLSDFNTADVELLDEYLVNATELEIKYLKSFDADKLLKGFAAQAGITTDVSYYGGWENTAIKGHTLGHYLTAMAQTYEATQDAEVLETLDYIVDRLAEYQAESGYLAAIPESHYEQIEKGNTTGTWVPWYTMHKVLAGVIKVYQATGNETALDVAVKLGDWVYSRTSQWSVGTQLTVLSVEYGGMNDCLYELYSITKSEKHLQAAHSFYEMKLFDSLYNGEDVLDGLHANTTIPKILGALNRYITVTDAEDRDYYLRVAENFWAIVTQNHTYITGGNSEWEHFGKSQVLDAERTNCNCETCNTYNMLKLSRELYKLTGEVKYADYYETTFINAILSSQNPETGMTTYFQPMATGFYKVYSTEFTNFWCCTGSGMESFSKLGDSLYYHNENDIYVMQFFSSGVTWNEKNIKLTQTTDIPNENTTTLTVNTLDGTAAEAGIKVRMPEWAAGAPTATINGETVDVVVSGGVMNLGSTWKDGDVIVITYPIEAVAYSLPDNDAAIAFKYGPLVLSAAMGTEAMNNSTTGVSVTVPTKTVQIDETIGVTEGTVAEWRENVAANVVKADGALEFTLTGTDSKLVFTPHYEQYTERYGIYFYLSEVVEETPETALLNLKTANREEAAVIDLIPVSNDQYELAHELVSQNSSTGSFGGLMYRDATQGGYFQYTMKVDGDAVNYFVAKYYSGDAGRTFSIYANDELLTDVTLEPKEVQGFYEVRYEIPQSITAGQESVIIKVAADKVGFAGGMFENVKIVRGYYNNATLESVEANGLSASGTFKNGVINVEVLDTLTEAEVSFVLTDANGLLYVDGVLVDDTKAQMLALTGDTTEVPVTVYAEDHETKKEYTLALVKSANPTEPMPEPEVTEVPAEPTAEPTESLTVTEAPSDSTGDAATTEAPEPTEGAEDSTPADMDAEIKPGSNTGLIIAIVAVVAVVAIATAVIVMKKRK